MLRICPQTVTDMFLQKSVVHVPKDWCVDGECVLPFSRGAAVTININGEEFCKVRNRRTDLFLGRV